MGRSPNRTFLVSLAVVLLCSVRAGAEAQGDRFSAGGYFRIMTRPDFQGGSSKLGLWNVSGRLLNEGPWAALEMKLDLLQSNAAQREAWAAVHAKVEGGSFANADPGRGRLDRFALSQLYVQAGNILLDGVTWQLGTLDSYFGDLGLYDMRPAQIFYDTIGLSGRYRKGPVELLIGGGDSGYYWRGADYSTLLTGGGSLRVRLGEHLELGGGGQVGYGPEVAGDRFAPYQTPDLRYEDFHRHEVVKHFLEENPGRQDYFPQPAPTSSLSYKAIGYLGFGKLGPLRWSNLFFSYQRLNPDNFYTESYQGREYTIYVKELTDKRYQLSVGNEMYFHLVPQWLDATWALLYGYQENKDNRIAPGEDNRIFYSTVLRLQLYMTETVHLLGESSMARERSLLGNLYREHLDSVMRSTRGVSDARGLEWGDTDTRDTWQIKGGIVLNPLGRGIYLRPSLRLLYGLQYSNAQNAFGNSFVESLDQNNLFGGRESHWHSVVAVETEGWF